jgi:predicted metal-dependent hydrolase
MVEARSAAREPKIEVRNLRFPLDAQVPKHWFGGAQACTTFWDNLSVLFPAGERFFMNAVRAFETQLSDDRLREDVRRFYQQEALHSREHVRYNDMLRAHGYPVDAMDESVRKLLTDVARLSPEFQLAVTCGLEHFTALLAQLVLSEDSPFEKAHPVMAALWRWHAAEENEHASVAFDVFRAIGGSYRVRVGAMVAVTLVFWGKVAEQQVHMMRADGTLGSLKEWSALARFLLGRSGWLVRLAKPYLAYYRPDFHPSQLDASPLLARWREEFEAFAVYRDSVRPLPKMAAAS